MFQFSIVHNVQQHHHHGFCNVVGTTLCVENHLLGIATGANTIMRTVEEIENHIITIEKQNNGFEEHIENVMKQITVHLPTHHYSDKFLNQNNINQIELIRLFQEHYNAMIFYNNSINIILNLNHLFRHKITNLLTIIPPILKDDVICNYQLVLRIYSNNQFFSYQIDQNPFKEISLETAPSVMHNVYSIIIAQELKNWMNRTENLIKNLKWKLF
ncbi:unnamed protein product [Rotaria sp. Silwood1]|nr:unnamed protein product [Rotaria sp. Silwood1]